MSIRCPACPAVLPDGTETCTACGFALVKREANTRAAGGKRPPGPAPLGPETRPAGGKQPAAPAAIGPGDRTATPDEGPEADDLPPGSLLWNRFRIETTLGRGGMGVVYKAVDEALGETVAVKVLSAELTSDPVAIERLKQEVLTARKLQHPNIVRVTQYYPDERRAGFDMEYLEGATLADHLAGRVDGSPFAPPATVDRLPILADVVDQLAEALDHIHSKGLVHRDVKPSNVMLVPGADGTFDVKVLDFGIVQVGGGHGLTGVLQPGTLEYMSPELRSGRGEPSPRSDVYSMGKVVYYALTAEPAEYGHDSDPPSDLVQSLPPSVDAPVLACMGRLDRRPESAGRLAGVIREAVDEHEARVGAEREAKEEAERKAGAEAKRRAKAEAELKAKEEAERKARAEALRKAEEERKAKAEALRETEEETERGAREEARRKAEAERKTEAEHEARKEAERQAREDAGRKAKEEARGRGGAGRPTTGRWLVIASAAALVLGIVLVVSVPRLLGSMGPDRRPFPQQEEIPTSEPATPEPEPLEPATPVPVAPIPNPAGIDWRLIEGGSFTIGSKDGGKDEKDGPQITIPSFEMSRSEVTVAQYQRCVEVGEAKGGCSAPHWDDGTCYVWEDGWWADGVLPQSFRSPNQPIVCVTHEQARRFAIWAGGCESEIDCPIRLPSEAEWEFAARDRGKEQKYPWGDELPNCDVAVVDETADGRRNSAEGYGCGKRRTWEVCQKPAGDVQGLCDMTGNVWEWVDDCYSRSYEGIPTSGEARTTCSGSRRVCRGGSWNHSAPGTLRVANRYYSDPSSSTCKVGFRLARDVSH